MGDRRPQLWTRTGCGPDLAKSWSSHADFSIDRLKSATARRQLSSLSPSHPSRASTRSSSGMSPLHPSNLARAMANASKPHPRAREEVLRPPRPHPGLAPHPSPPQALKPLAHIADAEAPALANPDRRARRHPRGPRLPRRDRRQAPPHQGGRQQGPQGRPRREGEELHRPQTRHLLRGVQAVDRPRCRVRVPGCRCRVLDGKCGDGCYAVKTCISCWLNGRES
jgi:hypothetical protein